MRKSENTPELTDHKILSDLDKVESRTDSLTYTLYASNKLSVLNFVFPID